MIARKSPQRHPALLVRRAVLPTALGLLIVLAVQGVAGAVGGAPVDEEPVPESLGPQGTWSGTMSGVVLLPGGGGQYDCTTEASITRQGASYQAKHTPVAPSPSVCSIDDTCTALSSCVMVPCIGAASATETYENGIYTIQVVCVDPVALVPIGISTLTLERISHPALLVQKYRAHHVSMTGFGPTGEIFPRVVELTGTVILSDYLYCNPAEWGGFTYGVWCRAPLSEEVVGCGVSVLDEATPAAGSCGNPGSPVAPCQLDISVTEEGVHKRAGAAVACAGVAQAGCGASTDTDTLWPSQSCVDPVVPVGPLYVDIAPDSPCLLWLESNEVDGLQPNGENPDTCVL